MSDCNCNILHVNVEGTRVHPILHSMFKTALRLRRENEPRAARILEALIQTNELESFARTGDGRDGPESC
jgi:hypothetical protein